MAHGPNYAVVPKELPIAQYVAAVENACTKLEEGKARRIQGSGEVSHPKDQTTKIQPN